MIVYFARSNTAISWMIRALTWSRWSHVAVGTPEGTVLEARWPSVREVSLATFLADNGTVIAQELPCQDPQAAAAWGRNQVGKPYDWRALFGFILHRDWHHEGQWWCSELEAVYSEAGKSPQFRADAKSRITPEHVWLLAPLQTGIQS